MVVLYADMNEALATGLCPISTQGHNLVVGQNVLVTDDEGDTYNAVVVKGTSGGEALVRIDYDSLAHADNSLERFELSELALS